MAELAIDKINNALIIDKINYYSINSLLNSKLSDIEILIQIINKALQNKTEIIINFADHIKLNNIFYYFKDGTAFLYLLNKLEEIQNDSKYKIFFTENIKQEFNKNLKLLKFIVSNLKNFHTKDSKFTENQYYNVENEKLFFRSCTEFHNEMKNIENTIKELVVHMQTPIFNLILSSIIFLIIIFLIIYLYNKFKSNESKDKKTENAIEY